MTRQKSTSQTPQNGGAPNGGGDITLLLWLDAATERAKRAYLRASSGSRAEARALGEMRAYMRACELA